MGHEVERVLDARGHSVSTRIDPASGVGDADALTKEILAETDVCIEFSLAEGVAGNAALYAETGTPAAVGTTGWDAQRDEVKRLILEADGSYIWGANFSVGAHIFFALATKAADIIESVSDYDIMVHEYHHKMKKDSPSGTALTVAEKILGSLSRKKRIVTDTLDRSIEADELHVSSTRGGAIPGIHSVLMDSEFDSIELRHTVRSRGGLALGAVMAAEWIVGRKGFYRVEDFIQDLLS